MLIAVPQGDPADRPDAISGGQIPRIRDTNACSTQSTARKNTLANTAIASTSAVVIKVSRRVGQTTFEASVRTCCRNSTGLAMGMNSPGKFPDLRGVKKFVARNPLGFAPEQPHIGVVRISPNKNAGARSDRAGNRRPDPNSGRGDQRTPRSISSHYSSDLKGWQEWQDSNLQHPVLETGTLPVELHS